MLAEVKLARYKIIVMDLKPRRVYPQTEDGIFINDRDVFFGYGYQHHVAGKYFDLWFTNPKDDDPENFVTLGRIIRIEPPYHGSGAIYVTKFGRFYVQEMKNGKEKESKKDKKGRKNGLDCLNRIHGKIK